MVMRHYQLSVVPTMVGAVQKYEVVEHKIQERAQSGRHICLCKDEKTAILIADALTKTGSIEFL